MDNKIKLSVHRRENFYLYCYVLERALKTFYLSHYYGLFHRSPLGISCYIQGRADAIVLSIF